MVDTGRTAERNRRWAFALVGLVVGVLVLAVLLIQRLPAELTVAKSATTAPSSASQPGLFDTLLAMHPSLPAAHEAVINAFYRFKASLRPEPPVVIHPVVTYEADENGNFVPVR